MTAAHVLAAIRAAHPTKAVVHEVVIHDGLWDERAGESKPTRRIDALMFDSLQRTAIEIKVSKADLLRDTWRKRAPWVAVTHRFVYAMPTNLWYAIHDDDGMLTTGEFDFYDCGVWLVDEAGRITVARKAKVRPHPEPLPQQVVQLLAYRAAAVDASHNVGTVPTHVPTDGVS